MTQRFGAIRGFFRAFCVLGALAALFAPSVAFSVPPKYFMITEQRVETQDGQITAKCNIGFDNVVGLFEMLKDGASLELVVKAKLERVRSFWTNVSLAEKELVSALQHNPLTREFALHMPGEESPLLDKNLDRLLAATWNKFAVAFGSLTLLDGEGKDLEYQIVLTFSLQHAKPPPWLVKNFMLWSKSVVDPETITLPFSY
ncbi:DUF4390 domain-containing protein [Desulfovibrio sp. OttesenSCG-928-O18]|nr:DUF4390 domain-containing protein [Desulfovibrio sp. OttesenSCG-928-O18]